MASSHAILNLPTSVAETINTIEEIRKAIAHITGTEIYNKPTKLFSRATNVDRAYEAAPVLHKLHKDPLVVVNWLVKHEPDSMIEFLNYAKYELSEHLKRQQEETRALEFQKARNLQLQELEKMQELEKRRIESAAATVTHQVKAVVTDSLLIFRGKDFYEFQQFYKYRVTRDGLKFIPYPENIDPNKNKPNVTLDQIDEALDFLNKPHQLKDRRYLLPPLPSVELDPTLKKLGQKLDGFTSKNKALTLLVYFSLMIFTANKKNPEIFSQIGNTNLSTFEDNNPWAIVVLASMFIVFGRAVYKDHEARKADKLKQADREPETEKSKKMAELIKAEQAKVEQAKDVTNEDYIDRILFLIDPELRNELTTIDQRREFFEVLILNSIREIDSVMDGEYHISGTRIKTTGEIELLAKRKAKEEREKAEQRAKEEAERESKQREEERKAEEAHKEAKAEVAECLAQIITTLEAQQSLIPQKTVAQEEQLQDAPAQPLPQTAELVAEVKKQEDEKSINDSIWFGEPDDDSPKPKSPLRELCLLAKSKEGIVRVAEPDSDMILKSFNHKSKRF